MADYYPLTLVAQRLGLAENDVAAYEARGFLRSVQKGDRKFYPARQVTRLQAALRLAQQKRLSLEQSLAELDARHSGQSAATAGKTR